MTNYKKILIYMISLAGIAAAGIAALSPVAGSAQTVGQQTFCPSDPGYGYFAYTDASAYASGRAVSFCLQDDTRLPIFENVSLWAIKDSAGHVVYEAPALSSSTDPSVQPAMMPGTYYGSWNQTDQSGTRVAPGTYSLVFLPATDQPSVSFSIGPSTPPQRWYGLFGYYPVAGPSAYYILPGNSLSISGRGFAPNETVTLYKDGSLVGTYSADQSGLLQLNGIVPIAHGSEDTRTTLTLVGSVSGYDQSYRIVVGSFYPNITPSGYYVFPGQAMTVSGTDFAPNEPVSLSFNGAAYAGAADGSGRVSWALTVPASGGSYPMTATGAWSGTHSSRTVTVASYY